MAKKRVLVGSPVHQKPKILKEFLTSLVEQKQDNIEIHYIFFDDNDMEESSILLAGFKDNAASVVIKKGKKQNDYICDDNTHYWSNELIWKVAGFKNQIIEHALKLSYDYLFLIDSDIIIHPDTIQHLAGTDAFIVSEIFWTSWSPGAEQLPNVWLYDNYDMTPRCRGDSLNQEEAAVRRQYFLDTLRIPGTYEVGMLGACTLIDRSALLRGVNFEPVKNLSFWGEDRHFCVRASVLGIQLFVDTYYPAYHIYRDSDLDGVEEYKKK